MSRNVTRSQEPQSRLERILEAVAKAMESHPEYRQDDKAIVMLDSRSEGYGSLVTIGYGPDEGPEAASDLIQQTEALFKANGYDFTFVPIEPQNPEMQ